MHLHWLLQYLFALFISFIDDISQGTHLDAIKYTYYVYIKSIVIAVPSQTSLLQFFWINRIHYITIFKICQCNHILQVQHHIHSNIISFISIFGYFIQYLLVCKCIVAEIYIIHMDTVSNCQLLSLRILVLKFCLSTERSSVLDHWSMSNSLWVGN